MLNCGAAVGAGLQSSTATAKSCVGSGTANAAADTRAGARMARPALESFMAFEIPCGQPKLELQEGPGPRLCCYTVDAAERGVSRWAQLGAQLFR